MRFYCPRALASTASSASRLPWMSLVIRNGTSATARPPEERPDALATNGPNAFINIARPTFSIETVNARRQNCADVQILPQNFDRTFLAQRACPAIVRIIALTGGDGKYVGIVRQQHIECPRRDHFLRVPQIRVTKALIINAGQIHCGPAKLQPHRFRTQVANPQLRLCSVA